MMTYVVVELGLCDGVVDVDGWDLEFTITESLVKVVNTGSGLLRNTSDLYVIDASSISRCF